MGDDSSMIKEDADCALFLLFFYTHLLITRRFDAICSSIYIFVNKYILAVATFLKL